MSSVLNGAIRAALVADGPGAGTLVALTTNDDAAKDFHIGRNSPQAKERKPYLGFDIRVSTPAIADSMTRMQRAIVEFNCITHKDLLAMQIADRLEYLLHQEAIDDNRAYWNVSDANVSNRQTDFISRDQPEYDEETDSWMVTVVAALWWINQPCPV